ncbi:LTA synthase family protein [Reyranella sp. CPCC 100927]|uniref:LTA synthase family protein n=1 Tax=Reyranella sp. CPCC 100927 TaxID=2599616 RepID=UPI0011B5965C|nr:sulfatase-like hydrolase/transferase [Reyranella sp. CPCC 100927]TWT02859.1 sulfatase-like hydrolase/transferase [Reyranella sp. CPCC 100927]
MVTGRADADFHSASRIQTFLSVLLLGAQILCVGWMVHLVLRDESGRAQQAYVFLIFGLLALFAYGFTRRPAFSLGLVALLIIAIHGLSSAKYEYLRAPMLIEDVSLLLRPEISELLLHGYPQLSWIFLGGMVAFIAYWTAAIKLEAPWHARRRRWASVAAVVASLAGLGIVVPGPGPLGVVTAEDADPSTANSDWDLVSRFFASSMHTGLKRPVFAAPLVPWLATGTAASPVVTTGRPDIVVVLEESTFNPQTVLPFCSPLLCERPMLTGSANSAAVGPLRVHVVGGLTWLSEFAFLSGMPHSMFGQAGQFAPAKVLPRVKYTLPRWLKTLGYRTVVVYPVNKHAYGGAVAYPMYGFDQVLPHPLIISGKREGYWDLSDRELLDYVRQVIAEEDAKPDREPLFIFVLTLQQHGPHGSALNGQPPRDDRPTFPAVEPELNVKLNDYLTRLQWSNDALRDFDTALSRRGQPYVLAHFGDHQPSFEGLLRGQAKRPQRRQVPADFVTYFNIQAGGGLPRSGYRLALAYPVLDIALLGGLIIDVAGLPKNPYFAANIRLRERCEGLFIECADKETLSAYQQYIFDELGAVSF